MTMDNDRPDVLIFVHGMFGSHLTKTVPKDVDDGGAGSPGEQHVWLPPSLTTLLGQAVARFCRGLWTNDHSSPWGYSDAAPPLAWMTQWSTGSPESANDHNNTPQQADDGIRPTSLVRFTCSKWTAWTQQLESPDTKKNSRVAVLNYLWDWRRPLEETTELFLEWLEHQGLSPKRRALLVTYSTGSLVGWAAVNHKPELLTGWVSVGGAVGASNFMLRDFEHGWSAANGLIPLLSPETNFSMSSLYTFFPCREERSAHTMFAHTKTGLPVDVDLYDPQVWKDQRLGLYAHRNLTADEETHLAHALAAAERFRRKYLMAPLVSPRGRYDHLSIVLFGSKANNATHMGWKHDGARIRTDLDSVLGSGDGTVADWAWNVVPGGLPSRVVTTDTIHLNLMDDAKLRELVASMLGSEERAWDKGARGKANSIQILLLVLSFALLGVLFVLARNESSPRTVDKESQNAVLWWPLQDSAGATLVRALFVFAPQLVGPTQPVWMGTPQAA